VGPAHRFSTMCCATSANLRCSAWLIARRNLVDLGDNGSLAAKASTMLSIRSTRDKVTPAPSAARIACTANVDTSGKPPTVRR
jgi:hypothetical protein